MPAAVAMLAALGVLVGLLVAARSGVPGDDLSAGSASASSILGLPAVRPSAGGSPVPGMTLATGARAMTNSAVEALPSGPAGNGPTAVAPLRRTVQADLMIVAPFSLPHSVLAAVSQLPGVTAVEQIEAVRMRINGTSTAVLGVDPSVFRTFAARPTGASNALWQGVANGGIAVSYTMGKLDKLKLGGTVTAAGRTEKPLRVVAFGTMGVGGVDAVVSDSVARSLGAPAGNAIVLSMRTSDFTADVAAARRLIPHGAGVEQLVTLVTVPGRVITVNGSGMAGAGSSAETGVPATQLNTLLRAAMSRKGLPYIWGATGPGAFDCSGLVKWSFAQAGIVMPRVAADQALAGPAVPVSQLQPGDLLFYHTDPTAPTYISHVALYLGNGWMIQAPEPGRNVEVVPADFGSEFAGAIRVNPAQAASVAAQVG
ncbi:MAG TPA: C40 family peptidase [Trebonia sp.]